MSAPTDETSLGTLFEQKAQTLFIYVKIPVKLNMRADPFHQRENELARLLMEAGAGTVIGWGQSVSDAGEDGSQRLLHQRIDITTIDLDATRHALRTILQELAVPSGTEIHYTRADRMQMDIYTRDHWRLNLPST
ncbi:hypothetical protein LG200_09835 [Methylobacillus caricis]|uniref:hypothetical protein n=1 Tax=Methylobacillus caricis TaxID=1971611 RepID=UPI001CFFFBC9|nr:hypothetical protein [Methylobacillus caricis]MCB5188298.1 hypothetical protein [Methylobacillus caricis]